MASCRYDIEVKNVFPTRGRSWCKWEEDFLLDWLKDFGLAECARQRGAQVRVARHPQAEAGRGGIKAGSPDAR